MDFNLNLNVVRNMLKKVTIAIEKQCMDIENRFDKEFPEYAEI